MILRALVRLVGEVALWTGLVTLVAVVVSLGASRLTGGRWRPSIDVAGALAGALLLAGASDRLGLPQPVVLDVGRRPLPLVWVLGGAIAGTVLVRLRRRAATPASVGVAPAGEDDGVPE